MTTALSVLAALPAADVDEISIAFDESSMIVLRIVIASILFGIALDTRVSDFRAAIKRPGAIGIALLAQFLVLPALTFLLTLALDVRGSVALGMILVACCPPGNVSNIVTHQARGDVALSVSMTAVANLLSIVVMPLNFAFWGSLHPTGGEMMRTIELDALDMLAEVFLVIGVPFLLGIAIAYRWPAVSSRAGRIVGPFGFLALGGLILVSVANNWALFVAWIGVVAIAVALHDALALGLGYGIARAFRLPLPMVKAMTFEVGIRNAGLGLLLVFAFFNGLGGMALVAAWWGIWDIIAALTLARIWRVRTRERDGAPAAAAAG